jgi:putative peptidoglycan lipid II flippase
VALGVVLLPQLSAAQARATRGLFRLLDWGLRLVLLLALPCAVALLVFRAADRGALPLRRVHARDVAQTALALRGYGVGLLGLIAVKVLAPGFYARRTCARRCASPSACWWPRS